MQREIGARETSQPQKTHAGRKIKTKRKKKFREKTKRRVPYGRESAHPAVPARKTTQIHGDARSGLAQRFQHEIESGFSNSDIYLPLMFSNFNGHNLGQ